PRASKPHPPDSTKGSLGSPSRYFAMLFFIVGRPVVVFGGRTLTAVLSDPIRDQEQTYFFER
ncbi:MAG: hypothetical protein ABWZ39_12790, partial [Pseudomonas caspiana]